jgi:hypothetical protein
MGILEPAIAAQLKTFNETIVLPAFEDIREVLEPLGYRVWTTEAQTTGDDPFDELLHGLSRASGACFLADLDLIDSANAIWQKPRYLLAALMVQLPEELLTSQHSYENSFCLGVQCNVSAEKTISAQISVFNGKRDGTFSCFQDQLDPDGQDQAIANFTQAHIQQRFSEVFAGLRIQASEEPGSIPEPAPEVIPEPAPEVILEPALEPITPAKATALSAIPSPPPPPEPATQQTVNLVPKTQASPQEQESQRLAISKFLQSLDVKRTLWPDDVQGRDLDRLVEWFHAAKTAPIHTLAYRTAQDILNSQAAQFALRLKPLSALVLTDYFELYRSAVYRLCTRLVEAGADPTQVFIEQVNALRDPKAPQRANPQKLEEVNYVFRSIARQFGKPDEFLRNEWIGESTIERSIQASTEPEAMIAGIRTLSRERRVKFCRLSWGVLQVYQNEEVLLTNEPSPGRNGVERFLHSAWRTIEKPLGEVHCIRHRGDEAELIFERRLSNGSQERIARARVVVYGTHGWVFLQSYGFEED